jgi:hypothetical protein
LENGGRTHQHRGAGSRHDMIDTTRGHHVAVSGVAAVGKWT